MSILEIVPEFRGAFLRRCGYRSGKNCSYASVMEPHYEFPKIDSLGHKRPDGLISCIRGQSEWSAFIEAKSEKAPIRAEQIQDYCELANHLEVPVVISISNEFAKEPTELPYHLASNKRKKREVFHFAWAEIRTFLVIFSEENQEISSTEYAVIEQCVNYMSDKDSGVLTYDAMPQEWPDFVDLAKTNKGFNSQVAGLTQIVHGWQQERRDLLAKLLLQTRQAVEIRHLAGKKATAEERVKLEKQELADNYVLKSSYVFKNSKALLRLESDLKACLTNCVLEFSPPEGKKAKATTNWLASMLIENYIPRMTLFFDWPGSKQDLSCTVEDFLEKPDIANHDRREAPTKIYLMIGIHDVRRFKSRKHFITDLECAALSLVKIAANSKLT